jgi:hypothetical protein
VVVVAPGTIREVYLREYGPGRSTCCPLATISRSHSANTGEASNMAQRRGFTPHRISRPTQPGSVDVMWLPESCGVERNHRCQFPKTPFSWGYRKSSRHVAHHFPFRIVDEDKSQIFAQGLNDIPGPALSPLTTS